VKRALLSLLLLTACSESSDPEPASIVAPEADPPSAECREAGDRVDDAFTRPQGARLFRGVDRAPIATRGGELDTRLPRVVITADRLTLDDIEISGDAAPATLASEVGMRAALAGRDEGPHTGHGGGWENAVLLYVPGDTLVSRVRDTLAEMDPELRYDLVVQHPSSRNPEEPRPPAWLNTELERLRAEPDIEARRVRFRELFTRSVGSCAPARTHTAFLFGRDPAVPDSAAPSESLAASLLACACDEVDVDALVAIGILTGPPNRHPLRRLSFRRSAEPGERVLTAIASDTVSAFVGALASRTDPLRVHFATPEADASGDTEE